MKKRSNAGRTIPLPDRLPEQAEVERAIEAVLDRLRPKPTGPSGASQAVPARKSGPGRKDR